MKHFELTSESKVNEFGIKLFRIVCVKEYQWISIGDSYLADNVKICGDAKVVIIALGNAKVCGDICIDCLPSLGDNALIKSDNDYCYFQSFGQYNKKITAFKTDDSTIKINHGSFMSTYDEFVDRIIEFCESDKLRKEYFAIMDVIQAKFKK